jgi:predicted enzyme related to lactoylglutathione lyase
MPEMTRYEDGVPCWIDIGTTDVDAGVHFYQELFGWDVEDMGEETGHYHLCLKAGKPVAAIATATNPGPPYWTIYVNVDDVDAASAKAAAAGGTVVFGPTQVMTSGKMAIFQDTTGAMIAAWQAGEHLGAGLIEEPGTFAWSELITSDLGKSKAFYSAVFGWTWGGSDDYAHIEVGGRGVGGVMPRPPMMPDEAPDSWTVYFAVLDVDAALEQATGLGATVVVPATDISGTGRFAMLRDPQGAVFALFAMVS